MAWFAISSARFICSVFCASFVGGRSAMTLDNIMSVLMSSGLKPSALSPHSIIFGASFYSGMFSNISPYVVEVFPVSLGGRAFGLAQASNGIGKIMGPVCLALIAGSNDLVSPKATTDAVAPAFLFLAACELAALIAIVAFRREPHGKPMDIG